MDDTEFFNGLKSTEDSNNEFVAGAEHFVRLKKQTGLSKDSGEELEKMANPIQAIKEMDPALRTVMGIGAGLGAASTYLGSRPQKKLEGKSRAESELEGAVNAQKETPPGGFLSKIHRSNTELAHGYAKAFREHPLKAALMGAASGAAAGHTIGNIMGTIRRGGK